MVFSSYVFILLFLPAVLCGYYILSHYKKSLFQRLFLIAASLFFYAYFNVSYLGLILASIAVNYTAAQWIQKTRGKISKLLLTLGVLFNVGLLGYFLKMIKTPTAPVVLGFILGPMIEANFEQAMLVGDGKWSFFFAKPISAVFIVLAVISFVTPFILRLRKTRNAAALAEEANANEEEEL